MANQQKPGSETPSPTPAKTKEPIDLVTEIGTLTYPRAVERFGKGRAVDVIKRVAQIGGHGMFEEAEITSPLFGGLAMPDPAKILAPQEEMFPATLPNREFYFKEAQQQHEEHKKKATADRAKINEYLNSLL